MYQTTSKWWLILCITRVKVANINFKRLRLLCHPREGNQPSRSGIKDLVTNSPQTELWNMFAIMLKGCAIRRKVLADCYPGCTRRAGSITALRGCSFYAPHLKVGFQEFILHSRYDILSLEVSRMRIVY